MQVGRGQLDMPRRSFGGPFADRLVKANGRVVMCEVKSFATDGFFKDLDFQDTDADGVRAAQITGRSVRDTRSTSRPQSTARMCSLR